MPVYKKLNKIISSGQLGRLNLIQVNFGSYKDYNMTNRFFSRKLAGGALLDIGVYSLSLIRWFFKETPSHVLSQVRYAPTGVDEQAGILLMNDAAEMATVTLSLHSKQPKRATLSFDKAYVEIFEYPRGMQATITYTEDGHKEVIDAGDTSDALYYEVCDMEKAINSASSDEIENLIPHLSNLNIIPACSVCRRHTVNYLFHFQNIFAILILLRNFFCKNFSICKPAECHRTYFAKL